jgi:putative ABC transport system substrate-binding protein
VAWPLTARAQQGERVRRVGVLTYGTDTDPVSTLTTKLLRDELQKLGWIEGRNLQLDFRFGFGDTTQTRVFAADLVQLAPDVIVVAYLVALRALQEQTKTIPIVAATAGDLLENGDVRNPAHPEGNVTGFTNAFASLGGKWMQLLKEVAPNITRVLYISTAGYRGAGYQHSVETAARSLGLQVVAIPVSDATGMKTAIEAFAAEPNGGLLPSPGTLAIMPADELSQLAVQYHLPSVFPGGGLVAYVADFGEILRNTATYVDRLFRGAKVSDLPVQYPTKFGLVINLKTAKALGLEVPPSLLARADRVIE